MRQSMHVLTVLLMGATLLVASMLVNTLANPKNAQSGVGQPQAMARALDHGVHAAGNNASVFEIPLPAKRVGVMTRVMLVTLDPGESTRLPMHTLDAEKWVLTGSLSVVMRIAPGSDDASEHEVMHVEAGQSSVYRAGSMARVVAGAESARLLIVSQHDMSPLGGPIADHSEFDPGVEVQTIDLPIEVTDPGSIRLTSLDGVVEVIYS